MDFNFAYEEYLDALYATEYLVEGIESKFYNCIVPFTPSKIKGYDSEIHIPILVRLN